MILFFASDLIWATRIKGTADALGVECRPARTPDMLIARLSEGPVHGLIVDLESPETAIALIRVVRTREAGAAGVGGRTRVLAFGPHVATDTLQAARDAGADEVLARGAFDRRLPDILRELGGAGRDQSAAPRLMPRVDHRAGGARPGEDEGGPPM